MLRELFSLGIISVVIAALPKAAHGQAAAINGEIVGAVTDPSGADVTNAVVQVVNTATGFTQGTRTDSSGLYRFALLPIGKYDLKVQVSGFADGQVKSIIV